MVVDIGGPTWRPARAYQAKQEMADMSSYALVEGGDLGLLLGRGVGKGRLSKM